MIRVRNGFKIIIVIPISNRVLRELKNDENNTELIDFHSNFAIFNQNVLSKIDKETVTQISNDDLAFLVNLIDLSSVDPSSGKLFNYTF